MNRLDKKIKNFLNIILIIFFIIAIYSGGWLGFIAALLIFIIDLLIEILYLLREYVKWKIQLNNKRD
jgi:thiamine transporter ThiT